MVDSNPAATYSYLYGTSASNPGAYREMLQTFPVAASNWADACDDCGALEFEWEKLNNETEDEAAWNDTLEDMLRNRLAVEYADRRVAGFSNVLRFIPDVIFYGFGAYQMAFNGPDFERGVLTLWEIARHAITDFVWGQGELRPRFIRVRTADGMRQDVDFNHIVWVANNSKSVGELLGVALARPLLTPFETWRKHLIGEGRFSLLAAGVTFIDTPMASEYAPSTDDEAAKKTTQILEGISDGTIVAAQFPLAGQTASYFAPATAPPFVAMRADLERVANAQMGNDLAVVYAQPYSPSGKAEVISEKQVQRTIARTNERVNAFSNAIAQRLAWGTGYKGRIRECRTLKSFEVDALQKVRIYNECVRDGVLMPQRGDEEAIRDLLGFLPKIESKSLAIRVPAARDVLTMLQDFPNISEKNRRELLSSVGFSTSTELAPDEERVLNGVQFDNLTKILEKFSAQQISRDVAIESATLLGVERTKAETLFPNTEREETAAAPLLVGSLQVSLTVLQQLRPVDPTVAPLSRGAAIEIMLAAGVSRDSAERAIDAQLGVVTPQIQLPEIQPIEVSID